MIELAIWYLRKRNVSLIMNMECKGGEIKAKTRFQATYDTDMEDVNYLDVEEEVFHIPKGKFFIKYNNENKGDAGE